MPALSSFFSSHKDTAKSKALTWNDIKEMVQNPLKLSSEGSGKYDQDGDEISNKYSLGCIAAHDCSQKTKGAIEYHNSMSYLRVDSDENYYTIEELAKAVANIGLNTFVIHTSWSHKADFNKLKCLIPLSTPVDLETWKNLQMRVTESLHTDVCMNNETQISYQPATYPGQNYEHYIHQAGQHNFDLLPQLKPAPVMQKREALAYEGESLIAEYNSRFDWEFELQANGYKKKGKKWLSPTATSKVPGGSIFTGDDGKLLFHTHHTSDPIHALGAVDGFGFTCLMENKAPVELVLSLSNGELKEWNKKKQKAFAEAKEQEQQPTLNDADFAKFSAIFLKKDHELFGSIKAPEDGNCTIDGFTIDEIVHDISVELGAKKEKITPQQKTELLTKGASKPEVAKVDNKNYFPTPVDKNINTFSAPGLVGECINYINKKAVKPRETLSVGCALTAIGSIGALSHVDKVYGVTSNLFTFGVAGTGTGKDAVLQALSDLVEAAGVRNSIFGKFKSSKETYSNFVRSQLNIYNLDELGITLEKVVNSKESYLVDLIGVLMTLYSKSNGSTPLGGDEKDDIIKKLGDRISGLKKAIDEGDDKSGFKAAELESIMPFYQDCLDGKLVKPLLIIHGLTTPRTFNKIINREQVESGFLNRALIFREWNDVPEVREDYDPNYEMPINLAHELKKIYNCGNQKSNPMGRTQNYGDRIVVDTTQEAQDWIRSMSRDIHLLSVEHAATDDLQGLRQRQRELVLKVSLILAIGDGKVRTLEHVKWAQSIVDADVNGKLAMVRGDEEQEGAEKLADLKDRILDLLKKKNMPMAISAISKGIRPLTPEIATKILTVMVAAKEIEYIPAGTKGARVAKFKLI